MSDYKTYLAANILTEQKVVTYRLLSRALKVHVNTAKEFLFEFHRQQKAKKSETVHATYLICGTKPKEIIQDVQNEKYMGNDEYNCIQSSPFTCSPSPSLDESKKKPPVRTIILVREEDLEETRSKFECIDSIHIYSLGPSRMKDLQVLSDTTRELKEISLGEDPLKSFLTYGTIENKDVKKSSRQRPGPASQQTSISKKTASSKLTKEKIAPIAASKIDVKAAPLSVLQIPSDKDTNKKAAVVDPPINQAKKDLRENHSQDSRRDPASIFRAFARTQTKPKKELQNSLDDEKPIEDAQEDFVMNDAPLLSSDDDENDEAVKKKEREKALKEMMEESENDDEMVEEDSTSRPKKDDMDVTTSKDALVEARETTGVSCGKKRGRRRVIKKTTYKDEDGYLVTKEEQAWESFSEEELVSKPIARVQSSTSSKPKKATLSKSAQGNIMSFFGKK
ncbi:hypothetical protein GcC1_180016 [Golovinomyces cichoracearum]|uniref:DNA polymerase delta subunit 3 n=1 Tax=Golovinomyces cichoracearum TaxID=62708 RepID=A0A420HMW8_9PEZI|nr:hypothetical protein GcC1_180016 [Golovinomyces cichoracearum]